MFAGNNIIVIRRINVHFIKHLHILTMIKNLTKLNFIIYPINIFWLMLFTT